MNEERPQEEAPTGEATKEHGEPKEFVIRICLPSMPRLPRLLPDETRKHLLAARREMLLAVRSAIDEAIGSLDRKTEDPPQRSAHIDIS